MPFFTLTGPAPLLPGLGAPAGASGGSGVDQFWTGGATPPISPTNISQNQSQSVANALPANTGPPIIPPFPNIPWWVILVTLGLIVYVETTN